MDQEEFGDPLETSLCRKADELTGKMAVASVLKKKVSSADEMFCTKSVEDVLQKVLDAYLHGEIYEANRCSQLDRKSVV